MTYTDPTLSRTSLSAGNDSKRKTFLENGYLKSPKVAKIVTNDTKRNTFLGKVLFRAKCRADVFQRAHAKEWIVETIESMA